jgi:hypothetical protein
MKDKTKQKIEECAQSVGYVITEWFDAYAKGYDSYWGEHYTGVVICTDRMRKPAAYAAIGLYVPSLLKKHNAYS